MKFVKVIEEQSKWKEAYYRQLKINTLLDSVDKLKKVKEFNNVSEFNNEKFKTNSRFN